MTRRRHRLAGVGIAFAIVTTLVTVLPEVAVAAPEAEFTPRTEKSVPVKTIPSAPVGPDAAEEKALKGSPKVEFPAPATTELSLGGTQQRAAASGPIRVSRKDNARAANNSTIRVEVLPKRLDGPAFRLSGAEDQELAVEVDYSGFRDAYGGDWASRLKLAVLPDCALTTPDSLDCQPKNLSTRNDGSGTLTADVTPGPNQLFAVTATASSGAGDYQASSMSPGSTWSAGASSGDFSWEYDMDAPPSLEGPEPDLQLSYSSGNVDARTSATNNQPGWAGEGFDFNPGGYIERRYASCSTDTKDSNNTKKTGDLCWRTDNATLQLNGSGGEMVRDDVSGTWTLRGDDGSKIEKLSNKDNGDNNGEAWKITTRDGTQYFFGLNKLPGWATGKQTTNSAWTVPVFGNHSGEDCYKAGSFDTSWCQQAWRWNLDYVVDPHGNTMSYFYKTETNNYSRNLTATKVSNYVRDGYIERIDYGQRDGEVYTKPAVGQVAFTVADRCIPGTQCVTTQPQNWPDTPLDQLCTSTTNCGNKYTPSFWTQKRLAKVTTKVWNGTAFKNVDEWTLTHSYPAPGDGTRAGMWLDSIQRTGLVGGTATLPATTFEGIQLSNRVDGIEGIPPMNWWRLKAIRTETGAELAVNYLPKECAAPGALPAEDNNTKRCHPLKWTPDSLDDLAKERTDWFHKYVVSDVTEKDLTTGLAPEVTKINYVGTPAWHHDEEDGLVPAERKSWSQWRGYDRVQTLKGQQGGEQEQTEVLYFRGMDEDKTAAGALKDVKVVDSNGVAVDDSNQLAGSEREVITYDKAGGKVISREITDQWVSAPTATRVRSWGTTKAYKVGESAVRRSEIKPDGSALKSGSNNVFDAGGLVQRKEELHNLADPNDDTCTRYTYAHNAATHMMDAEIQEETVRVACDKTPNLPADLVSIERTYYDNSDTFGAAPVKGDPTRRDVFNGWVNGAPVFKTLGRAKFDIYGRAVEATDVAGKTSTTTYESTVGGPVTKVTTTNPLGQKSSTEYETAWGEPIAITDTNNKRTEKLHDPLGRVIKSWLPGRDRSQSPSTEHSYLIRTNGPNVVTNKTLQPNGEYTTEIELYDGQMRERQSQEPAPGGGRVITDTIYDSRGLEVKTNGPFYNDAPPGTDVVTPDEAMLPTQRVFEYDGEGRLTAEILKVEGTEKWRTTHSYDGRQYSVDPPDGETPTTKITDAEGRLVELRQYKGNAPTGEYDKTTYTYTPHGQLETVTDPAGNVWRHEYDMLGREIKVSDPDRGVTEITYDNYDQVATKKDATGKVLAFAYDDIGRTTAVHEGSLAGPKLVEWGFDKLPDGTSVPGVATSSTRYVNGNAYTQAITSVDSGNRPTGMSITIPASEGKLAGTYKFATNYKADGDVADTTLPAVAGLAEEKLTFGYNSLGLPTTLTGQTSYVTNTSYTPYSEPQTVTLSAGGKWVKRSAEYEIGTRRVQRTITERETPGRVVSNVSYTYDAAGNITRIHNQPGADTGEVPDTQCFQHDYLRRMTGAWTPRDGNCAAAPSSANLGGAAPYWHGWTYDKAGNRTSETKVTPDGKTTSSVYTYPAPGQAQPHAVQKVTTTGPSGTKVDEFGYDPTGNTTSRKLGTAPGQTLEWDAEGLLTKVTEGSKVTSYVYDADGNRLIRRDSTGVTLYLGATEVLLNPAGALQATRSYVHDDETVAIRTSNGKLHWLDSNHVGTAEVSIDADTQEVSRRRTDPFGGARGTQPTSWPGQKGFVGGTIDGDTGLTQLGERAYDTATGRFISADPEIDYVEPQQLNAFAYANNNPVTFSDPDGRYWVVVLIPIAVRVLVPVLTRVLVPVLRRVFVWVAKQVVRFIGWLLKKLVSTKWVQVAKTVTVIVAKWVVKWVAKTIQRIKKSKVWKEAKKKIAKAIGKKNVERLKKAREKVRKWVNKWKAKKKKGPNKPKEQKQPRKRQPKKKTEPRPDLYAIANASGPQIKKEADYEKVGDMVLSQEGKDIEDIKGFSTYNSPENLEKRLSTSGMHLYRLPKDAKLPEGLDWVFDNNPEGHHTIYASRNMSFEEYKAKIAGLEWQKVKKYPKKKSR
ncbi:RHS repeat-associated core domain-containing protein [Kibdelosporangium aridum]|uniref:RHS repeat-associated core domain-containing protein n=1 Tax=Kibdelosporangium aridum TaxID=2030 RepID=A0A1W2FHI8_KIBAR|nr:RHS repeat-associated core domain-containing protein [Kibdelosporangium aridum]SMD21132.1 RHS repeat-associated core domain-containing protein [Kibdelosporangium aridum]